MIPCLVYEGVAWSQEVKYLTCAKTVIQGILTILAGGEYDLLSPDGHGVQIVRSGEGLNTTYNVFPSKNPIQVDYSLYDFPKTLIKMARELEASDRDEKPEKGSSFEVEDDIPF